MGRHSFHWSPADFHRSYSNDRLKQFQMDGQPFALLFNSLLPAKIAQNILDSFFAGLSSNSIRTFCQFVSDGLTGFTL